MTELSRRAAQAARRLADQNTSRFDEIPTDRAFIATVTGVTTGTSPKGNATIVLRWRGTSLTAKDYCAAYTPAAGHRVVCQLIDNQLVVLDRLAG